MSNTVKRIKEYINYRGISVRRFEESVGFSNGAFASQFKRNKTIGVDRVEKILEVYTDLNPIWLLTGCGNMVLDPAGNETEEVQIASDLSGVAKNHVKDVYYEKYLKELEIQIDILRKDLTQKQDIIESFLSGSIARMK